MFSISRYHEVAGFYRGVKQPHPPWHAVSSGDSELFNALGGQLRSLTTLHTSIAPPQDYAANVYATLAGGVCLMGGVDFAMVFMGKLGG